MLDQLPSLLSGVIADGCSSEQWQASGIIGAIGGTALASLLRRRLEAARDILLEELRSGETRLPPTQIDEGVAITYRYFRAAQEGAARLNLRLMAKVISGQAHLSNLKADEFLHDADMIASLRREEVFLLAKLHHAWSSDWLAKTDFSLRPKTALDWVRSKLIPAIFRDVQDLEAAAAAVVRTGLLTNLPTYGGTSYQPTSRLDRLVKLASFEAVLSQEE